MANYPNKIDGIGTRKDGSGGFKANTSVQPKRIIRMIGFSTDSGSAVTYTKGDAVALQIASANVGGTDILSSFGTGNVIKLASATTELLCVGIVAETITASVNDTVGESVIVQVQVSGIFEKANVATGSTSGLHVFPSSTGGRLDLIPSSDADTNKPLAIALGNASSNKANVMLLNPLSY
tara:strand:- start:5407 stop:5946 length:540 start_codon:yes stop_codon:yes gene_type:complete